MEKKASTRGVRALKKVWRKVSRSVKQEEERIAFKKTSSTSTISRAPSTRVLKKVWRTASGFVKQEDERIALKKTSSTSTRAHSAAVPPESEDERIALKKTSSTSTLMARSTPSRAPSTAVPPESEDKRMPPSTSSMAPSTSVTTIEPSTSSITMASSTSITMSPSTSITMALKKAPSTSSTILARSTSLMAPSTPIPPEFEWARSTATPEERTSFLKWARSAAKMADPDERRRLLTWAQSTANFASVPDPEERKKFLEFAHSTARIAAPYERKRLLHSAARITAPDERKTWSLQEEILKSFETALNHSYTDLKQEPMIYTYKGKPGLYECRNALWIWPKVRSSLPLSQFDRGPRDVGEKIKEKFLETDMIEERPFVNKLGFVTIKLSGKWIAESIHNMLKEGIDTWAPKLPVERVIVGYPSLDEDIHEDLFRQRAIRCTLMRILKYSKVDVTIGHRMLDTDAPTPSESPDISWAQGVLNRWFSNEERKDVVIKGKVPLGKRDFGNAYKDLLDLWYGLCVQKADWIVYITPVRQQEYIEMCLTAAKLANWIPSDGRKPTRTSYAGYRACTTSLEHNLLDKARNCCVAVEQGEAAKLLGYTAEAVLNCVFRYTFLKTHRLAVLTLDIDEMFKEEGHTFVYLLNTQAKIRRITDGSREGINELKKALKLILGKDEDLILGKDEEHMLGVHLLEFTEALEESCLSVLPHILCEYLYDLSVKFNSYYSSAFKATSVPETSTLLLCEATAVVMDECFHLLGITPTSSFFELSMPQLPSSSLFSAAKRPMDVNAREPIRNSRLELFSLRTAAKKHFRSGLEGDILGKLFGLISVSDKYGLVTDGGSQFFEPDFAHVPLFNHDWDSPINMIDWGIVYLGNSTACHSVPFASSLEFHMELYVTKEKNTCYQVCNHTEEIDLSDFWNKESDSASGSLTVQGEDGPTHMFYILMKDAVDVSLEVKFRTETLGRKVRGYVIAHYGDDFLYECHCDPRGRDFYSALLFLSDGVLEPGTIQLIKSVMAVPTKGNLIIKAYLEDAGSGEVIMKNSCKLKPQLESCRRFSTISGIEEGDCDLHLMVDWKYQT